MSTIAASEHAREALRREHGVRLVSEQLEGVAAEDLPAGTYGFTGSPLLASPLFSAQRYRNFEVHRLAAGPAIVGFVTAADAARLNVVHDQTVTVRIYPDTEADASVLVSIPYDRVVQHRQYSVRNADALTLQLLPAQALTV